MLSTWRHSGFHVFCGKRISPKDDAAMENLARYIIRASFSQERMTYMDQEGKIVYKAKDQKINKRFPTMECHNVLAYPQWGRADGAVLRIL